MDHVTWMAISVMGGEEWNNLHCLHELFCPKRLQEANVYHHEVWYLEPCYPEKIMYEYSQLTYIKNKRLLRMNTVP